METALNKKPCAFSRQTYEHRVESYFSMELILANQNQSTNIKPPALQNETRATLVNVGVSPTLAEFKKRKQRFKLRRKLQGTLLEMDTPTTWNRALKLCGTGIQQSHLDYTKLVIRKDGAHLPHTNLCKSWNCPYCSQVKTAVYSKKIEELLLNHLSQRGLVSFITSTAGFDYGTPLEVKYEVLKDLFAATIQHLKRKHKKNTSYLDYVKRTEYTINQTNGNIHLHLHSLLFFPAGIPVETQNQISFDFIMYWEKCLRKRKIKVVREGQDYQRIVSNKGIANYLAKTLSLETTSSNTKEGKGMNWFQFIESEGVFSKEKKERIIREITGTLQGKRLIGFSQGLNTCYKELEALEEKESGAHTEKEEVEEEIEMLTPTANALLMLHTHKAYRFIDYNLFVEDILHSIFTDKRYRARFKMICADTIELRSKGFSNDDVVSYFLDNLEDITLGAFPVERTLPSPAIH